MVTVRFTANLQRHLTVSECCVSAHDVRTALEHVFLQQPRLRSYLLDDQGRLRQHVAVFIDGEQIQDRERLSDTLRAGSEIYVVQALSGG